MLRFPVVALVAATLLVSPASGQTAAPAPVPPSKQDPSSLPAALDRESDVREPIFRDLIKSIKSDEACFLAFGFKDKQYLDPPADYLKLLADLKRTIQPASDSELNSGSVRDRKTKNRGAVCTVDVLKTVSDDEVILRANLFRGPLSGRGYTVRMVREGRRWIPKELVGSVVF